MKRLLTFVTFILLLFSLVLVACTSKQPLEPVTIEKVKTVTETIRDTVITTKADSTYYNAFIDCVNGKPVLREPEKSREDPIYKSSQPTKTNQAVPGKSLQPPKVSLIGNQLEVSCHQKAVDLFLQWKEKYIQENTTTTKPQYIEKPLKWWQKGLMWSGGVFLVLIAVLLIVRFTIKP